MVFFSNKKKCFNLIQLKLDCFLNERNAFILKAFFVSCEREKVGDREREIEWGKIQLLAFWNIIFTITKNIDSIQRLDAYINV